LSSIRYDIFEYFETGIRNSVFGENGISVHHSIDIDIWLAVGDTMSVDARVIVVTFLPELPVSTACVTPDDIVSVTFLDLRFADWITAPPAVPIASRKGH